MIEKVGDEEIDRIIDYVKVSDMVENYMNNLENDVEKIWAYDQIVDHQGPLCP